jgi:hypothetical protein
MPADEPCFSPSNNEYLWDHFTYCYIQRVDFDDLMMGSSVLVREHRESLEEYKEDRFPMGLGG